MVVPLSSSDSAQTRPPCLSMTGSAIHVKSNAIIPNRQLVCCNRHLITANMNLLSEEAYGWMLAEL
jgi:hypothetical protein